MARKLYPFCLYIFSMKPTRNTPALFPNARHFPSARSFFLPIPAQILALASVLTALLIFAPTVHAQEITSPDELGLQGYKDPAERTAILAKSTVFVRVTPQLSPYHVAIDDGAIYGAATLVLPLPAPVQNNNNGGIPGTNPTRNADTPPPKPVLLTTEFFVRNAQTIEIFHRGKRYRVEVEHADRDLGFASLKAPPELLEQLTALSVHTQKKAPLGSLYTLVFDVERRPGVREVSLGLQGEGALAFYRAATPVVSNGYPIVTRSGAIYGMFALRFADRPHQGFALMSEHVRNFLTPKSSPTREEETIQLQVEGAGQVRSPRQ